MGKKATLMNLGGEGSPRYQLVEEKGNHEDNADIDQARTAKYVLLPGETKLPPMGIDDLSLGHMANWFECMRSRQAAELHGAGWIRPLGGLHDGSGGLLVGQETVLGCRHGDDSRSGAREPGARGENRTATQDTAEFCPISRAVGA